MANRSFAPRTSRSHIDGHIEARTFVVSVRPDGLVDVLIEIGHREVGPESIFLVQAGSELRPGIEHDVRTRNLEQIILLFPVYVELIFDRAGVVHRQIPGYLRLGIR